MVKMVEVWGGVIQGIRELTTAIKFGNNLKNIFEIKARHLKFFSLDVRCDITESFINFSVNK